MKKVIVGLCLLVIEILPLAADAPAGGDAKVMDEIGNAFQVYASNLPALDITYTTRTKFGSTDKFNPVDDLLKAQLKIQGSYFRYEEEAQSQVNPNQYFKNQIAYDGHLFQILNEHGAMRISQSPNIIVPGRMINVPFIMPFTYIFPSNTDSVNIFEVWKNPETWLSLVQESTIGSSSEVDGKKVVTLMVKSNDKLWKVTLCPEYNYYPISWQDTNEAGCLVKTEAKDMKKITFNDKDFYFPQSVLQTVTNKSGKITFSQETKVQNIQVSNLNPQDKSQFQLPTSSAISVYDSDLGVFLKSPTRSN